MAGRPRLTALLALAVVAVGVGRGPVPARAQPAAAALTPAEAQGLDAARRLAGTAVRVHGADPVAVVVASWVGTRGLTSMAGVGAVYNRAAGTIYLSPRVLTSPHRDALVAATVAHHLFHAPSTATTLAEHQRERVRQASEAYVRAVEILSRAGGLAEPEAFDRVWALLRATGGAAREDGPAPACPHLRALLARFPQYQAREVPPACPPA
jgi:hypothetical protein